MINGGTNSSSSCRSRADEIEVEEGGSGNSEHVGRLDYSDGKCDDSDDDSHRNRSRRRLIEQKFGENSDDERSEIITTSDALEEPDEAKTYCDSSNSNTPFDEQYDDTHHTLYDGSEGKSCTESYNDSKKETRNESKKYEKETPDQPSESPISSKKNAIRSQSTYQSTNRSDGDDTLSLSSFSLTSLPSHQNLSPSALVSQYTTAALKSRVRATLVSVRTASSVSGDCDQNESG